MKQYDHYIDGGFVPPEGGERLETRNPYSGEVWATIARGSGADVDRAVAAAKAAAGPWGRTKASERGRLLMRLADLIEQKAEHLGTVEVRDNGKLFAEMGGQARYLAEWYRYYGGLADKVEGAVLPSDKDDMFNYVVYEPLGVVAMITPWNSPLLLLAWKLAPALAAGNCAVIKPSEFTSASTLEFVTLLERVGFPPGVVNVVTGFGHEVGKPLVDHPDVAKVAFTGSEGAGQAIYEAAARDFKHVTLELGGKSPNIVFADANLDAAVAGVVSGIFAAGGQTCIAGSRLLVQRSIHDDFVERLVTLARGIRLGDPMSPETQMGPVATEPQLRKILEYVEIATAEGAQCAAGGRRAVVDGAPEGLFVEPTIFTGVDNAMRIAQEEVFGPVLAVIPFDNEADAVAIANDSRFGLAAGLWTSDLGRIHRMVPLLDAGTIWVNTYRAVSYMTPFGGTKRSGLGRESGAEAIKSYLRPKAVWISGAPSTANPFVLR